MRRLTLFAVLALVLAPAAVSAQARILAGGGLSTPIGDFGDAADAGWHAMAGLQLGVPGIPIGLRADGGYHSFGEVTGVAKTSMLSGALSAVYTLPGVGLTPYFLGGIGGYRTSYDVSGVDSVSDSGFHLAFGVNIGALGSGGFGEVRFVNVNGDEGDARFVTATIGIRL